MGNSRRNQVLFGKAKGQLMVGETLTVCSQANIPSCFVFQEEGVNSEMQRLDSEGSKGSEKVE